MKVGFISLGCSKNLVDTEMTIGLFKEHQYKIVNDINEAEIILINTCGFIESAKQEAIDTILEMAEYKENGICKYLIVMGCLVERYEKELKKAIPEVDLFIPIKEYEQMWEKIEALVDSKSQNLKTSNLDYLKAGGRISGFAAQIGKIAKLTIMIDFSKEGKLVIRNKMIGGVKKGVANITKGIITHKPKSECKCIVGHTDNEEGAQYLANEIERISGIKPEIRIIGPTIGAHLGPDAIAYIFISEEARNN